MRKIAPKIGDCFEVPLGDGRYAYGRFVHWAEQYGPLCEIYAGISNRRLGVEDIDISKQLFPPVYIGFGSVFSHGRWRIIGRLGPSAQKFLEEKEPKGR